MYNTNVFTYTPKKQNSRTYSTTGFSGTKSTYGNWTQKEMEIQVIPMFDDKPKFDA